MKKISFLFAAILVATCAFAEPFGIKVNGTDAHIGTKNPTPEDPSFQEYYVLGLALKAGDYIQLYDQSNQATWAVNLDPASVAGFTRSGDKINCSAAGTYDFYIKLKMNADQLYIGASSSQGGGQGGQGGQGGGLGGGREYYYYKGYINGADVNDNQSWNEFEEGIVEYNFTADKNYIFVIHQIDGQPGEQFMCAADTEGPSHATLATSGGYGKFVVLKGKGTLYLYDNGNGTLELSLEPIPGKTLIGGSTTPIENVTTGENIRKAFMNGQLVIIRDGVRYSASGVKL